MILDNSDLVAYFVPPIDDGDTFIYTEMLDRRKESGNNNKRLVKTFYHHSVAEFKEQWPMMKDLADRSQVRLMTRLAPRSHEKVGKLFTQLVVEAAMAGNWRHMKKLYNSACGKCSPITKLWLFDVDEVNDATIAFGERLKGDGLLLPNGWIPSKKGIHYIAKPHRLGTLPSGITLHKDNPTNLYIPDGAA